MSSVRMCIISLNWFYCVCFVILSNWFEKSLVWRSMHLTVEFRDVTIFVLKFNHISTTNLVFFFKFVSSIVRFTYSTFLTCRYQFIAIMGWLLVLFLYLPFCSLFFNEFKKKNSKANLIKRSAFWRVMPNYKWKKTHNYCWWSDIGLIGIFNFLEKSIFRHWQKRTSTCI